MINKNEVVNVYNENNGKIFAISANDPMGYIFEPASEDGEAYMLPIVWSDVVLINNRSDVFKSGTLRFEPDMEEDIYKELHIVVNNSRNYFTRDIVIDYILNPTAERLEEIKNVNSILTIEKFRNALVVLDNEGEYDISKRVYDIINGRYQELTKGKMQSKLIIKKTKNNLVSNKVTEEKIEEIEDSENEVETKKVETKKSTKSKSK